MSGPRGIDRPRVRCGRRSRQRPGLWSRAAGRERDHARGALVVLTIAVATLLAGCSAKVQIEPVQPEPTGSAATACADFTAALPASLSTVGERREVTSDSSTTAAYGDPPVGIRCGVPAPAALMATSTLVTVDGIDWFPEELSGGWRMTTIDRVAAVEITVPTVQGPAPSVASDLAPTIAATVPTTG